MCRPRSLFQARLKFTELVCNDSNEQQSRDGLATELFTQHGNDHQKPAQVIAPRLKQLQGKGNHFSLLPHLLLLPSSAH